MSTAEYGTAPAPVSPLLHPIERAISRGQRLAGLLIVLSVAILPFFVTSLLTVLGVKPDASDLYIRYRIINGLLMEATSLALLAYVVRQNRQTWTDLGFAFRARDLVYGILLWFIALCCYRLVFPSIVSFSELMGWHPTQAYAPALKLGGVLGLCFWIMSPIFEEMIVRAFLMSETFALTGSSVLAIVVSVLLQISYHLYQGIPYALSAGVIFLTFAIYYARTKRIIPVILAHLIWDVLAYLSHVAQKIPASHP